MEPPRLLFVGENSAERAQALLAGFLVAPHPTLALAVLQRQEPLWYLRIRVPPSDAADWRAALRSLPLAPLHLTMEPNGVPPLPTIYVIADGATAATLDDLGFWVDRLGEEDAPLATDLYLLRDDRQEGSGFLTLAGNSAAFFGWRRAARHVL